MGLEGTSRRGACSGSIVDATHVLTAGHCTYAETVPWSSYEVRAGIAKLVPPNQPEEQVRQVAGVRHHPYYVPDTFIHDVALLRVEPPFDFSTPAVQPIPVVGRGEPASAGTPVRLFGWGRVAPGISDGTERSLAQTMLHQWQCPWSGLPSMACMQSPTGSPCPGDSGGGLTAGSPPVLVATTSVTSGSECAIGELSGGTDLASPEINLWLEGDEAPPPAPVAETFPLLTGATTAGGAAECRAATLSGGPALSTAFVYPDNGQVVQQSGSSTYRLTAADAGHRFACVSIASNAGGTTEILSSNSALIAALTPRIALRAANLVKALKTTRVGNRWLVGLAVEPPAVREWARATWKAKHCPVCHRDHWVLLKLHTRITTPKVAGHGPTTLTLRLPELETPATSYAASAFTLHLPAIRPSRARSRSRASFG